jgi:tRNA pseudouridine38-40 synthase
MIECGRGKLDGETLAAILAHRDRHRAPAAAPPHGLYLTQVRY